MNRRQLAAFLVAWVACAGVLPAQPDKPVEALIRGKDLEAKVDPARGRFALSAVRLGRTFAREGKLRREGGKASVIRVRDSAFGDGQAIELAHADGERESILLFDGLPFVLFRS